MKHTRRGRITSRHGVLLPPKKKKVANKYITLGFVIKGTIPSKKNMIWADSNIRLLLSKAKGFGSAVSAVDWVFKNLQVFIRNSKKYTDWVEQTKPIIQEQAKKELARYEKYGIIFPVSDVSVKVYHYWADNLARDNSNKYDSIIDCFVSAGILTDDKWQVVYRNESESELYKNEILQHITLVDVTCRIF